MNKRFFQLYKALPTNKKEIIFKFFSEIVEKADKDQDGVAINRIERSLTRKLSVNWNSTSTKAVGKAIASIPKNTKAFTEKDSDKIIGVLEKSYLGVEKPVSKFVEESLEEIYKINKRVFGKKFNLDSESKKVKFKAFYFDSVQKKVVSSRELQSIKWDDELKMLIKAVNFGAKDEAAYMNLARLENVAIGDHFPRSLKSVVVNTIRRNVIEKGLDHITASKFLENELTRILGGNISAALPQAVTSGKISTKAYFESLNATNVTWARNFSQINLMDEAGVASIIFNAILDRTTSQVCAEMDGRIFTIKQALEHQKKVLSSKNVEAVQEVAPFMRDLSSFGLKAGQKLDDVATQDTLAKAGVLVPPLHSRCYGDKTEVFTSNGWKFFKDVIKGDKIFSLNPDNSFPEWVNFKSKVEKFYSGEMFLITNIRESLKFLVTPDHYMFFGKRIHHGSHNRTFELFYAPMEVFLNAGTESRIVASSEGGGTDPQSVTVGNLELSASDFAEIMGYYLAGGYLRFDKEGQPTDYVDIFPLKSHEVMYNSLDSIFSNQVKQTSEKLTITNKNLSTYCRQFGDSHNRYVPEIIKSFSKESIKIFLNAFYDCNVDFQYVKEDSNKARLFYCTISKKLSEDLAELIIRSSSSCYYEYAKIVVHSKECTKKANLYKVVNSIPKTRIPKIIKRVPYKGQVYDLALEKYHTLLVRYEGKVAWGSNCRSELQPL